MTSIPTPRSETTLRWRSRVAKGSGVGDQPSNLYPVLEYTDQFRESDLNLAHRQMERYGISLHFRHQKGSHTLMLSDDVWGMRR